MAEDAMASKEVQYMPPSAPKPLIRIRLNKASDGMGLACILAVLFWFWPGLTPWSRTVYSPAETSSDAPRAFDWSDRVPVPYLDYETCYGSYQCAMLELPMDHFNGSTNATIGLAIIRSPAVVPVTHPQYGGAIVLNPGGPGGSGIGLLLGSGESIRATVDANATDDSGKYFDLISFDPRGVGATTPSLRCFEDEGLDSMWMMRMAEEGWFESSDAAMGRLWSMYNAKGLSCSDLEGDGTGNIKRYVSTAYVARDMVEIAEKHGAWRESEAKQLLQSKPCHRGGAAKVVAEVPATLKYKLGEEKLQYWGFSYGTYLGSTFAAMFPDRVGRLVLDGVVDAYNYKTGEWSNNLIDTEKVMNFFYENCARVGSPICALANKTGETTVEGVKLRTLAIVDSLYHDPLPVYGSNPDVVTYSDIRSFVFLSIYSPMRMFPQIADLLFEIEAGNGEAFAPLLKLYHATTCTKGSASRLLERDTLMGIACSDGDVQTGTTKSEFHQHYENLLDQSPTIGGAWASIRLACIHYRVRAMHRFAGPWMANTSNPVLFIGNTMDPVTPNAYAHKMAKGFEGAVALTQDSAGHCSISTYSSCTVGYIHGYFQTGAMPPVDTVCKADGMPFGPGKDGYETNDVELAAATKRYQKIADAVMEHGGGLGGARLQPLRKALLES